MVIKHIGSDIFSEKVDTKKFVAHDGVMFDLRSCSGDPRSKLTRVGTIHREQVQDP